MPFAEFWMWLENLPISMQIGGTWWFPLLESIHVVSAMFVVGTILMVDLRLLGLAARSYAMSRIASELVRWTWGAFIIAVLTGVGMFVTRASWYIENRAFQIKLLLLLLAGINMAVLHRLVFRDLARWDEHVTPVTAARISGAASLVFWIGITLAGRWTGHLL